MASGISSEQASMNAAYAAQIASAPGAWGYQSDMLEQLRAQQQAASQSSDPAMQELLASMGR